MGGKKSYLEDEGRTQRIAWGKRKASTKALKFSEMYLIQLLLPLHDNNKQKFPPEYFSAIRDELTERFGGVTAFFRSPAIGLWKEGNEDVRRDDVVMFEIMSSQLDENWWREYRLRLQQKFLQEEILIWASKVTKL